MSHGSTKRETPRDVQCEHCGRFYRNDGIAGHEANCEFQDLDRMVVEPEGSDLDEGQGGDVTEDVTTPQDGEVTAPDALGSDPVEEPEPVRTDGGPQDPPEPDLATDGGSDQEVVDEVPDKYEPVEDWIDEVESERPELQDDREWQAYRSNLINQTDYVDLDQTDADRGVVVAVREEEI